MSYEEPTNEFRQVKRPIKRGNQIAGPGYYETVTGYDVTIQRKWLIDDGEQFIGPHNMFPRDEVRFIKWTPDDSQTVWQPRRIEWRDLPIVHDPKAP